MGLDHKGWTAPKVSGAYNVDYGDCELFLLSNN